MQCDRDMLLHDDVVGDGEAKASALSGGFCREKGIEHLVLFTMMSWVMERPRPVPSPAGFVVKKGLNILSLTSGGMPVPLSRIVISTRSPRFFVEAVRVGSWPSLLSCSLGLVAA